VRHLGDAALLVERRDALAHGDGAGLDGVRDVGGRCGERNALS